MIPDKLWIAAIVFALGAAVGGGTAWGIQGWRLDAVQAKFDGFVATTRAEGEAAQKIAAAKTAADQQAKKEADDENLRTLASLRADVKRLRDARPSGGLVPAVTPGARRPDLACFSRTELERALGDLVDAVRNLADEGSAAAVDLNTARTWVQRIPQ